MERSTRNSIPLAFAGCRNIRPALGHAACVAILENRAEDADIGYAPSYEQWTRIIADTVSGNATSVSGGCAPLAGTSFEGLSGASQKLSANGIVSNSWAPRAYPSCRTNGAAAS